MKFLKSLVASAALLLLAACSTPTQKTTWDKIQESGKIVIATPGTLFPTSYTNDKGELIGYEIDMLNEIAKRLNLKVEYTKIGVAEALTAVDSGKVDISVNNFDMTKERLEKYLFSVPYKYSIGGMIVRADDTSGITNPDLSDWKGKKAGGGAGTNFMKITQKLGGVPVLYDNVTNDVYLRDVSTGRTDFIPNDYYTQVIAVKVITAKFPDIKVKMGNVKYNPSQAGIVMRKNDVTLQEKINGALKAMLEDGTMTKISHKYYGEEVDLSKPLADVSQYPVVDVSDVK